jgi:T5SS/PEP-CTERM-associated repeat protein/autotransporter-associated beta strand protein
MSEYIDLPLTMRRRSIATGSRPGRHPGFVSRNVALALVLGASVDVHAGNTWDGGGANDNWTTGLNWNTTLQGQVPPLNNGTANLSFPSFGGLVQTPIIDVPYSINSLTFGNGDGRYVILGASVLTVGAGGIINNDGDFQSIIGTVKLAANQTWLANAARLQVDAADLNGFNLTVAGAHEVDLLSIIIGSGGITIDDAYLSTSTMLGLASNTYTGLTEVHGGTLALQKSAGVAIPGDLAIHDGGTVILAGDEQIAETPGNVVTIHPGGLIDVNAQSETISLLNLAGTVSVGVDGKLVAGDIHVLGEAASWSGTLLVGDAIDGSLNILSGSGLTTSSGVFIANQPGSVGDVVVDGSGSTWNVNGNLIIGNSGDGAITMSENAGLFTSGTTSLGANPGSTGSLTVGETLSVWDSFGNVYLGGTSSGPGGVGTLTINPGGVVDVTSFPFFPTLYLRSGSTLNLTGGALLAIVVNEGGTFNWTTGNFIDRESQALVPGPLFSSPLVLDDAATTLSVYDLLVTDDGAVEVSNNASLGGAGLLRVANGTMNFSTGGKLSWMGGAAIGDQPGTTGAVTMNGLGCDWSNDSQFAQELNIGEYGAATAQVLDAAVLSITGQLVPSLGRFVGSEGTLVISGPGSQCSVETHPLYVGAQGDGFLTIDDGATLDVPALIIAESGGSSGEVTIDGLDTSVTSGSTSVGNSGFGSLTISGGASMNGGDIVAIAQVEGSEGHVIVTGPGSQLTASGSSGYLFVGGAEDGSLAIDGGAAVHAVEVIIGDGEGVLGTVTVSGADSQFTADESIEIGFMGAGALTLEASATASSPLIEINSQSALGGSGTVIGEVSSAGTISPGLSAGALAIDGTLDHMPDAQLQIELGGLIPIVQHDVLTASGDIALGGTLHVTLISGFAPRPGDCFEIISSSGGAIIGEFASIEPPGDYELQYARGSVTLCALGTPCVADIAPPGAPGKGDGVVGPGDLAALLASWGACPDCPADFTGDNIVGPADLAQLLAGWGPCD